MQKHLSLITVPYDASHFNKRMGAGPLYLINQGLVENLQNKGYEVDYGCIRLEEEFPAEIATTIKLLHEIKIAVTSAINNNSFPIVLSGNCCATVGVVNGLNEDKAAVLWFDAHGDCETPETTVTGFLDGMGLSMLMHCCWENLLQFNDLRRRANGNEVILVGARDLSISEEEFIKSNNVQHITVDNIRDSKYNAIKDSCDILKQAGMTKLHLHVDVDVLDTTEGTANSYAVENGLSKRELFESIRLCKKQIEISSLTVASYDPNCDVDSRMQSIIFEIIDIILNLV